MDNKNRVLSWAARVADIYKRLVEIDEERAALILELEAFCGGDSDQGTNALRASTKAVALAQGSLSTADGGSLGGSKESLIPSGGAAKKVHEFMIANPGEAFTPLEVTQALGLGPDRKAMVNTALSRLYRAKILERPESGKYLFPKEGDRQGIFS